MMTFFLSLPKDIIFRILDYTTNQQLGRFDKAWTNHNLRGEWVDIKKKFYQIFRKITLCDQIISMKNEYIFGPVQLKDGRIAFANWHGSILLWDLSVRSCVQTILGHTDLVRSLVQLKDGRIASGSCDGTVKIWNVMNRSFVLALTLIEQQSAVYALVELDDGRLASAGEKPDISIWNIEGKGFCEKKLTGHTLSVWSLNDGRIASGSNVTIKIWNVANGTCDLTLLQGHDNSKSNTAFSFLQLADGRLLSRRGDGTIMVFNLKTGSCQLAIRSIAAGAFTLVQLPDGRVVSGGHEGFIRIWDLNTRSCQHLLVGHRQPVFDVIQLNDERILSSSVDRTIRIWSLASS